MSENIQEQTFEFALRNPDRTVTATGQEIHEAFVKVIKEHGLENLVLGSGKNITSNNV